MRLAVGATVLATATACGAKHDPYAASLAEGSEHVEFVGSVYGTKVSGRGDFTNDPDRGHVVFNDGAGTIDEVMAGHTLYTHDGAEWRATHIAGLSTPAQMFRAHVKAAFRNGLVRRIVLEKITYTFSKYGEHVSVHVPRVKGTK